MRGATFLLLFFIIYDVIITWLFFYIWWRTRCRSNEKDSLINDLSNELAKLRKKWYFRVKEGLWKRY